MGKTDSMMKCSLRRIIYTLVALMVAYILYSHLFGNQKVDLTDVPTFEPLWNKNDAQRSCVRINNRCYAYTKASGRSQGLGVDSKEHFTLDGQPLRIISGSFHYFRTHPAQWVDRLYRMKAAGLNTVMTYIPWNLHEASRGKINLGGSDMIWDLKRFIELVHTMGMYLIVRPGPYICAEWELGGFPSWLLHDPNMIFRTSKYRPYLKHVEQYFNSLLSLFYPYTFLRGGPIIAFQVENEFGSYGNDLEYLSFLVGLFRRNHLDEMLFTSDGWKHLANGSLPNILATINFKKEIRLAVTELKKFQPSKPLMVVEFWNGWFDHWGSSHQTMSVEEFTEKVDEMLALKCSINFYMFTGGTNFGFFNGANYFTAYNIGYHPTVTSYDYDGLISESGDVHPTKYAALRKLLIKHGLVEADSLPSIPSNIDRISYSTAAVTEFIPMDAVVNVVAGKASTHSEPLLMEFLNVNENNGQSFGWILYRCTWSSSASSVTTVMLDIEGTLNDRGLVFVNQRLVSTIYVTNTTHFKIQVSVGDIRPSTNTLEILVENMGRVNYMKLNDQRRGFKGSVSVDGTPLKEWYHVPLEFDVKFIDSLSKSKWSKFTTASLAYPAVYRATFEVSTRIADTFIDMEEWEKGIVFINGFNLGRYWRVGPQRTLYLPAPLLKTGTNELLIFELGLPGSKVKFSSVAMLNHKW